MDFPMRINKYLAHKGLATRRSADVLIERGLVLVNNQPATLGQQITATDTVTLKSEATRKFRYIIYNKPQGVVTSATDKDQVDIAMRIKRDCKITNVFPIGRLDKDTEGLILLTDDGRVTDRLLRPEHEQEYLVRTTARVTQTFLNKLVRGVRIKDHVVRAKRATPTDVENEFTIVFAGSTKYHIRRMCAALDYHVTFLRRVRFMHLELKKLKPGAFHELTPAEVVHLKRVLQIT